MKKKDAFEEAVEILKGYYDGLPPMKNEACCSGCDGKKEEGQKKKRVQYEAEF